MWIPDGAATDGSALPVALDAMGADRAPEPEIEGAIRAFREYGINVRLVGRQADLEARIRGLGGPFAGLTVVDAPSVVTMAEDALTAVRQKTGASVTIAMQDVRQGRAAAVVSAGNSGAVVASALFVLGRLKGVDRPAIGILLPTEVGGRVLLLDAGAVVEPRPRHMLQFAYLATSYLRHMDDISMPRIGLISNGEEPGKGHHLARESYPLLAQAPGINFTGNVEGNVILSGAVDAAVCDGFTGNVVLKTAEGAAALIQQRLRSELTSRWYTKLLALGLRRAFRRAAMGMDYRDYGGAPLLGVQGVVVMAHGRSDSTAIRNAIRVAHRAAERDLPAAMARELAAGSASRAGTGSALEAGG